MGLFSTLKLNLKHFRALRVEITEITEIQHSCPVVGSAVLEMCAILGFRAAQSGTFLQTLRYNLLAPSSTLQQSPENGTDRYSRNVANKLPFYAVYYPQNIARLSLKYLPITKLYQSNKIFVKI